MSETSTTRSTDTTDWAGNTETSSSANLIDMTNQSINIGNQLQAVVTLLPTDFRLKTKNKLQQHL